MTDLCGICGERFEQGCRCDFELPPAKAVGIDQETNEHPCSFCGQTGHVRYYNSAWGLWLDSCPNLPNSWTMIGDAIVLLGEIQEQSQ